MRHRARRRFPRSCRASLSQLLLRWHVEVGSKVHDVLSAVASYRVQQMFGNVHFEVVGGFPPRDLNFPGEIGRIWSERCDVHADGMVGSWLLGLEPPPVAGGTSATGVDGVVSGLVGVVVDD